MRWVHSPLWDGFFLLSGLPIGLMLIFLPASYGLAFFAAAIVLETGHVLSPIVLTWTHAPLRRIALEEWGKWLMWPSALVVVSILTPMTWVFAVYWSWNVYHFGMQNYGVVSLWRPYVSQDSIMRVGLACLVLTTLGMGVLPIFSHDQWVFLLMTGVFSFNHWLTDLGLCSRVSRHHWMFLAGMLVLGCIGFVWLIPRADHIATRWMPWLISARWGVGFVHFLYSRWIWRLPEVQKVLLA